jgi:hypothetical protein
MRWRLLNGVMGLLFLLALAVQYNDPDPLRWMLIYGAAAACCGLALRGDGSGDWRIPAVVAVAAGASILLSGPSVLGEVSLLHAFRSFRMHEDIREEIAREITGLAIVVAWCGLQTGLFWKRARGNARPRAPAALLLVIPGAAALGESCSLGPPPIVVHVSAADEALLSEFLASVPYEALEIDVSDDGEDPLETASRARGRAFHLGLRDAPADASDPTCAECFLVERADESGRRLLVRGTAPLGLQYGLGAALEALDFRFFHPFDVFVPEEPRAVEDSEDDEIGEVQRPEIARRGLHLHTLHPIEGLEPFWVPTESNLAEAKRILDWTVKLRANYLQWVALDDISSSSTLHERWARHTADIIAAAHARGIEVGIGIQLFGASNLQQAFDLVDQPGSAEDDRAAMDERLAEISGPGLDWDVISLSFGEFFGADPATFVARVESAYDAIQAALPGVEVVATIHVGNYPDLRVDFEGEEDLLYYFLVQFAERPIRPWIHTVMYYDLFEDAGGAYLHDEFDEHRDFLLERVLAGEPVGYHPESAYWVAFDNPIPLYLPLYIRSRWTDLRGIRDAWEAAGNVGAGLQDHVLFSSGWEWGYWQNDYLTMRMSWALPETWEDSVLSMLEPLARSRTEEGVGIQAATALLGATADQARALIEQRLAPWLAGRDSVIDFGDQIGILSQPDRPTYEEIASMDAAQREAVESEVVAGLDAHAQALAAHSLAAGAAFDSAGPASGPWAAEIADGVAVDVLRASFAASVVRAVLRHADGDAEAAGAELDSAAALLEDARAVVARRHAALHHPDPARVGVARENPTIYEYGYLYRAETLCFWERELLQARELVSGIEEEVPGCAL